MVSSQTGYEVCVLEELNASDLWRAAQKLGFPSAIWKLPHTNEVKLLISVQGGVYSMSPDLEKMPSGFIMSAFGFDEQDPVLFMEGDIIVSYDEKGQAQSVNKLGEEHPVVKKLLTTASEFNIDSDRPYQPLSGKLCPYDDAKERFKRTVELAVAAINNKEFKKVVLSRTREMEINKGFEPIDAFFKLTKVYVHAFVSLVNLPEQKEMWLGATPETLVSRQPDGNFRTMSLAGTQKAFNENNEIIPRYDIKWGQKEIEEQALVSRYIVECFKKIRLREYTETGPKTVLAGNVYHLRTEFDVDTVAVHFPELATTMLKLLHPTSAVCGVPKKESRLFIDAVESYDRSFYSGFLGPVQVEGQSSIFVNLRTVRLKDGIATFYAGGGITEDSVPELEWEETELKCNTLLRVIGADE
jgi:isochorismate synthase